MNLFLSLLIYLSKSDSEKTIIFTGNWIDQLNSSKVFSLINLSFYHIFKNTIRLIDNFNDLVDSDYLEDDFILTCGRIQFKKFKQNNLKLPSKTVAGVFRTSTFEFLMVHIYTDLPIQNDENTLFFHILQNEFDDILSIYNTLKSISENFNFSEIENYITKEEIQELKGKYQREKNIKIENYDFLTKQIFVEKFELVKNKLLKDLNLSYIKISPIVYLKLKKREFLKMKFDSDNYIEGFYIQEKRNQTYFYELKANQIKKNVFSRKIKLFVIIYVIYMAISWFLLKKIRYEIQNATLFRALFILIFDFSFTIFFEKYIKEYTFIYQSQCFLFNILSVIRYMYLYSIFELPFNDLPILISFQNLKKILVILCMVSCNVFVILRVKRIIKDYCDFLIFHLSIELIPQIIFNSFNYTRNLKLSSYMIALVYLRFIKLSYYFLCMKNNCKSLIVFYFIFISIQSLILIVQCIFPSTFSLRNKIKRKGYNYYDKIPPKQAECVICYCEINEGSNNCMTTPCNHVFHDYCLQRWMNEKMICPICRAEIPPDYTYPPYL